jgi:pimeloyl-ACP methyl ester carboxylesterase
MLGRIAGTVCGGSVVGGGAAYYYLKSNYPAFLPPIGPYPHIAAFHCRCGEVGAQIFYPARDSGGNITRQPYLRDGVLDCLVKWLEFSRATFFMLEDAAHPCLDGMRMEPIHSVQEGKKLPVIIFQHGLGGTSEMYSQLCLDLSSFGFVVVAVEHEDGSGIYALDASGKVVRYRGINEKGAVTEETMAIRKRYDREEIIAYRRPMLNQRVEATESAIIFLQNAAKNKVCSTNSSAEQSVLAGVLQHADTDTFYLVGHSFGACSSVVLAQVPRLQKLFKGVLLLDLWPYPLKEAEIKRGLKTVPCLSIYSQHFVDDAQSDEALTKDLVLHSNGEHGYVVGIVHQSFSDAALWFPEVVGRQIGATGMVPFAEARQEIISWAMRSLLLPDIVSDAIPPSAGHAVVSLRPQSE